MKSRLHRIEIRNFKAFREFILDLKGRHLLIYGPNGSGKSSLYWALYTFLQSARKPTPGVAKYFDPADPQNLLNLHEQGETAPMPGEIALTLRDAATRIDTTYRISQTTHATHLQPAILKGDLASDFITYRFFFGFSHFRNSEKFNLWPLFEKEILPFCVSTGGKIPLDGWLKIRDGKPNPYSYSGLAGTDAYDRFHQNTAAFAAILPGIVDSISIEAQRFYNEHFAADDPDNVTLKVGVTTLPSSTGNNQDNFVFTIPVIEFGIQIGGNTVTRPQAFLNEAKLTQLALSVRFAASLVNLNESDLKLLVLDDLLVSLDMSNRMKVVEILLSETFANYQKIILTHELGFFHEFRRKLGASHPEWCFLRLEGDAAAMIEAKSEKTYIQKAEDYLHGHNLDEAALCLRKACEDTAKRFTDQNKVIPTKDFVGLSDSLRAARNKVLAELPVQLYEKVLRNTPDAYRNLLVTSSDDDIETNTALDNPTKGRLKTNRERLRRLVRDEHVERLRQITLIDKILACTERVLNPAAHSGMPPLYEKEVQDALALIKRLEATLMP
ncbi:MAG TPA: ATP-binding protein [Candidatus Competibacter sp.]|nr:AAA family ATPase [Candidatus Competibacteraceae bacterium]HPE70574.1 ATP-binding protein [Candidatus Competibacter sp.]HRX70597.1 ATP-binding protein [Candidatus Competibacteraceae bacterium]